MYYYKQKRDKIVYVLNHLVNICTIEKKVESLNWIKAIHMDAKWLVDLTDYKVIEMRPDLRYIKDFIH